MLINIILHDPKFHILYLYVYNYSMKIFKYHDDIFWTNRPHITNRPHMRAICKNFRERGGEQKNFLKSGFFTL